MQTYNTLTPEESRIIIGKWTEAPYSWEYENHHEKGNFVCRQCEAVLFTSDMKFDSGCGWPSFDDALPGRVTETVDADGRRTEITCTNCGWHLGHVFVGERITPKNTRHCVNSLSMKFVKETKTVSNLQKAYFAGWCFWCIEGIFEAQAGVKEAIAWYAEWTLADANYERVSTGNTAHREAIEVIYDPSVISYTTLVDLYYTQIDPTQKDGQFADRWFHYTTAIYYQNATEKSIIETAKSVLESSKKFDKPIAVQTVPFTTFFPAEEHHQDYYKKSSFRYNLYKKGSGRSDFIDTNGEAGSTIPVPIN